MKRQIAIAVVALILGGVVDHQCDPPRASNVLTDQWAYDLAKAQAERDHWRALAQGCDRSVDAVRDECEADLEDRHMRVRPMAVNPALAPTERQIDAQLAAEPKEGP